MLQDLLSEVRGAAEGPGRPPGDEDTASPGAAAGGSVLVIDGRTLEWALGEDLKGAFLELSQQCKAVLCCRSTPLQKSQVVQLVRSQLGVMTLAVGEEPLSLRPGVSPGALRSSVASYLMGGFVRWWD